MIALLDTNAFLHWVEGDDKLSAKAKSCIADPNNEILVSLVVAWELAIKSGQGGIKLAQPVMRYVTSHIEANDFRLLSIGPARILHKLTRALACLLIDMKDFVQSVV